MGTISHPKNVENIGKAERVALVIGGGLLAWYGLKRGRPAGYAIAVSFSGLAPGYIGLYQINAHVPANAPAGDVVPVVISIGGANSNAVTIAVQ